MIPNDTVAEAGALACVLSAPNGEAAAFLDQLEQADFHDIRHQRLFQALLKIQFDNRPLNLMELAQRLRDDRALEDAGGMAYLAELPDATPSPANFPTFLETVKDRAARRQRLAEAKQLERTALDLTVPVEPKRRAALDALPWTELNKPVSLSDNLLGNRFLERGQGLLLYGPAGCGKSVAGLQGCVEWAAGLDGLHIAPVGPLRIVVIQTEDSLDDTREALAGIRSSSWLKREHQVAIERNLVILPPVPGGSPDILARYIEQAATQFKPDLMMVNPLLAFCPGDPARELGGILYGTVDPVIKRHRLGFLGVHHTPKTNNRDTSDYGRHDHQYLAAGDARVANWPRAMVQIEEVRFPTYRFRIAKRGHRAGWTWDGKPATERYFQHHACEVRWIDAMPEAVTEAKQTENYREIVSVLPAPDKPGISRDRVQENAKAQLGIGKHKADSWLKLAIEDGIVERIEVESEHKRKEATFRLKEVGK